MPCDPEEICEECPEWIFTLADLLMCMMGLFVILWVLKPSVAAAGGEGDGGGAAAQAVEDEIRETEVLHSIRQAFGAQLEDDAKLRLDELYRLLDQIRRNGEGEKGNAAVERTGADGTDPEVTRIRDGERAGLGGRATFDAGSAKLDDDARAALAQVAGVLRGRRNVVLVKGHTALDDVAGDPDAPAEWVRQQHRALSLARASAAAEALIAEGVAPEVLRVQACGPNEPLRRRAYADADRRVNRRVEVEATDQLAARRAADRPRVGP